ncbi:MAG TPA: hypothetical protein VK541_01135 [Pedobacter sp.]|uniref:hypothetical protein n=1 Tax=Pedobacter sp. TaxID=1411316 RepID=UPI002C0DFF8F|nr:hypothetical protein [Pedobacter sp.]HMI01050.1 hypothetical protein [Pedobacter sp.]
MALAYTSLAQNPTFTINEAALAAGQVTIDASGYNYNKGLLSLLPGVQVKSNSTNLTAAAPNTNTIPVTRFTAVAIKDGSIGTIVTLSTANQIITNSGLLGLLNLGGGDFSVRYAASNLSSFPWQAGNYSTILAYSMTGLGLFTSLTPASVTLSVNVPAFITPLNEPGDIELLVDNLNYFRTTQLSIDKAISHRYTVPLLLSLKSNAAYFTFSNGHNGVTPPQINVNLVNARITAPVQNPLISLSNTSQQLYSGTVPAGNTTANTALFSISSANLLTGFINKGTYATTLNLEAKDASGIYPAATRNKTLNLKVTVNDLSELAINTSTINLKYITAENYRNGVAADVVNHLVVSKTTPYDITVKSDNANFTLGANTIPVSVLSIGPSNGQTGVNTINSLSTQPQMLVNAGSPAIDRNISLRYFIPASKTVNLLNKQAGTYTTNVTYTLTAH